MQHHWVAAMLCFENIPLFPAKQIASVLGGAPVSLSMKACVARRPAISWKEMNTGNQFASGSFALSSCATCSGLVNSGPAKQPFM